MTNEQRELNPEIDTTRFVNIDNKPFDIYINGKVARHLEAGEEQVVPVWVAQTGAKHLSDRIQQVTHGIKDTFKDTKLRQSLFARILPDMAQERKIEPLKEEEFQKVVQEQLKEQSKVIASLQGKTQTKDEEIDKLKTRLAELEGHKSAQKKPGRPARGVTLPDAKDVKLEEEEK